MFLSLLLNFSHLFAKSTTLFAAKIFGRTAFTLLDF